MCGREIEVIVGGGNPEPTAAFGWLPADSCSNVMAEFCPSALFFCSGSHLDTWRSGTRVATGEELDVESLDPASPSGVRYTRHVSPNVAPSSQESDRDDHVRLLPLAL